MTRVASLVACLEKRRLTPTVYLLRFAKPAAAAFQAGQFALLDVPALDNPGDVQPRAYSIASSPGAETLTFVIKCVPGGRASRWVQHRLAVGMSVRIELPFGAFTVDEAAAGPLLFVATGTGLAPIMAQVTWLLEERRETRRIDLVFGVLRREELFFVEELRTLERRHATLRVWLSVREDGGDTVQTLAQRLVTASADRSVYLCGAPETVEEMRRLCREHGVRPGDLHNEAYG